MYGEAPRRYGVADAAGAGPAADPEEVSRGMRMLRKLWYSPALIAILVFVLGAPKKVPK